MTPLHTQPARPRAAAARHRAVALLTWTAVTAAASTAAHAEPSVEAGASTPSTADRPAFYVRLGAAFLKPVSRSSELELVDVHGAATLALQDGPIAGSGGKVDSATIPAAIVGYVLPTSSRKWSIEGVLGIPFTVKFRATGTLATMSLAPTALGIPTGVGPLGSELGEATALPIVATLTYQPIRSGVFRPYAGAGPSVLFATNAKVTNPILTEVNHPEMSITPAPGLVLQGGLEARFTRSIYARLDVKFIAFMMAHAEVRQINVKTPGLPLFDSVEVGTAKLDVTVNPLIVQAGIGMDFDLW